MDGFSTPHSICLIHHVVPSYAPIAMAYQPKLHKVTYANFFLMIGFFIFLIVLTTMVKLHTKNLLLWAHPYQNLSHPSQSALCNCPPKPPKCTKEAHLTALDTLDTILSP